MGAPANLHTIEAKSGLLTLATRHVSRIYALVLVFSCSSVAWGQTGRIEGEVVSSSGDPLPGVTVTMYSSDNSLPRVATTDESGRFVFAELGSAIYMPVAVLPGFEQFIHSPIQINGEETLSIHINLRLAHSEEVTIEDMALRQGDEPIVEQEFSSNILEVLPLPADRFQEAMPLLPVL